MNKWRNVFVTLAGEENVSQVVDITGGEACGSDFDVYKAIEAKLAK